MSAPVTALVEMDVHAGKVRLGERSRTYCFFTAEGQRMTKSWVFPRLERRRKTEAASLGSVPALYSCQLLAPSPSASAVAAESRLLMVPKKRNRHESGMPSLAE